MPTLIDFKMKNFKLECAGEGVHEEQHPPWNEVICQ